MNLPSPSERLEAALYQRDLAGVSNLASTLRDEGMAQRNLYDLYQEFYVKHADDTDDAKAEAIADTLDAIVGCGCSSTCYLYNTVLTEVLLR